MFEKENGYSTEKSTIGQDIIYDISTNEEQDYRFIFRHKDNDVYVAELGYKGSSKNDTDEITGDFYDVNKVISTVVGIFIGFYLAGVESSAIIYKFQLRSNKSYRLLINSLFKKELTNYYNLITTDGSKNFDTKRYLLIRSNRSTSQETFTEDQIENLIK